MHRSKTCNASLSRRTFLKTSSLSAAGLLGAAALAGCNSNPEPSSPTGDAWDYEADVVVVGTGTAGVAAAKTALDAGSSVIMVEKETLAGGVSSVCEQFCAFDSNLHLPQNFEDVEDSAELMLEDALRISNNTADKRLAKIYCDQSADAINWMLEQGCEFKDVLRNSDGRHGQGKYITAVPGEFITKTLALIEEQGGTVLTEMPLSSIIRDDGGRAVGIGCANDTVRIKAVKGLIVCSGPWTNDETLTARHTKAMPDIVTSCAETLAGFGMPYGPFTGESIIAAQKAGAAVRHMEHMMYDPYYSVPEIMQQGILPAGITRACNQVLVTPHGVRFTDEGQGRGQIALDALDLEGSTYYPIIDGRHLPDPSGSIKLSLEKLPELAEAGILAQGETVDALALDMEKKFGVPATTVLQTIERYNSFCVTGTDEDFGKDPHLMTPIDQPPFVAGPAETVIPMYSHGGLEINEDAQVVDVEGNPIPGLYAAGMCTGGVLGSNTISGNWQTSSVVFGRIAGQNASAN